MEENENERLGEIAKLEGQISDLPNRQKEEILSSGDLRECFLSLFIAERLLRSSDPLLKDFQLAATNVKKAFTDREKALQDQLDVLRAEQRSQTEPYIRKGIEALRAEGRDLKLEESFEGQAPSGFSGPKVNVSSNRPALLKARELINSGIEILKKMDLNPVVQIQEFLESRISEIRAIDFLPRNEIMLEVDYNRTVFLERAKES